jgi:peptidoglycan-N-acetylglucosamine deacetylase
MPDTTNGRRGLTVTMSFDDGSVSDLKTAALLKRYSLKATFYVPKDYRWLEPPLTRDGILALGEDHEIGAHTLTHPDLGRLPEGSAREEIAGSKRYLERLLGREVRTFCYPGGYYNVRTVELVREAGFLGARTVSVDKDFGARLRPFELGVTSYLSNRSTRMAYNICRANRLSPLSMVSWAYRAKVLFNKALKSGGVYHLFGHSAEIEAGNEWKKLEAVCKYISGREGVEYVTNGELLERILPVPGIRPRA